MNFREVTEGDFVELSTWFADIRKPYPIKDGVLPLIGVVAFDEHGLVACCFLKQDGSSVSRLEWIASSPIRANAYRSDAIKQLLDFMVKSLKAANPNSQIIEIFTQSDFLIASAVSLEFKPIRNFTRLLYTYDSDTAES